MSSTCCACCLCRVSPLLFAPMYLWDRFAPHCPGQSQTPVVASGSVSDTACRSVSLYISCFSLLPYQPLPTSPLKKKKKSSELFEGLCMLIFFFLYFVTNLFLVLFFFFLFLVLSEANSVFARPHCNILEFSLALSSFFFYSRKCFILFSSDLQLPCPHGQAIFEESLGSY